MQTGELCSMRTCKQAAPSDKLARDRPPAGVEFQDLQKLHWNQKVCSIHSIPKFAQR